MLTADVRERLEGRIIAKAWESDSYKESLQRNPRAVILAEIDDAFGGRDVIPSDWEISVHQETANSFHMVIPRHPDEQPDVLGVDDVSPSASQDCNTPAGTRCGCCSITQGAQSKCADPAP